MSFKTTFPGVTYALVMLFVGRSYGQFLTADVGVVRECFGVEEVAGCHSGSNATASGSYFGTAAAAADCFDSCYSQEDCTIVAYFVPGGLCYNLASCDVVNHQGTYTSWRFFRRTDYNGYCSPTEAPASGSNALVVGGSENKARASKATIGGGVQNLIDTTAEAATILGGRRNTVSSAATASVILAGDDHQVSNEYATIIGGYNHTASAHGATILSGRNHIASGRYSTILAGYNNFASGIASTLSGGSYNIVSGDYGSLSGGRLNEARGAFSVVGGGLNGFLTANYASTLGGYGSKALSRFAQVLGGSRNEVRGRFSAALGFQAQVTAKYSLAMGFKSSEICSVSQRKSIAFCADEVLFGDLDLVQVAQAKTAIGRRLTEPADDYSFQQKVSRFANALKSEVDAVEAKLTRAKNLLASALV